MSHRQQLQTLAKQVEVFESQHTAMGQQIAALKQELLAAFQSAPKEEEVGVAPPVRRYINDMPKP